MKAKLTKVKSESALGRVRQLFSTTACLGAVILICSSASARNLFMSDGYSGIEHNLGHSPSSHDILHGHMISPISLQLQSTTNFSAAPNDSP
jgi:hypothetical protein